MYLRQSTAAQSVTIGPFIDDTDFKTPETALTINNTDIKLMANGGASANKNSGGATHTVNGEYTITLDATDSATVGELKISVSVTGALPWSKTYRVLEEAVYDALFAASAPGYVAGATVTTTAITAAALQDLFDTNSGTTYAAAVSGSVVKEIADNAGGGGGSVYLATGTVSSATSTTTLLDVGALATSGFYVGARLRISAGTGAGQERIITDYTAGRVATHAEWVTNPDNTSTYFIEPARTALADADGTSLVFTGAAGASEIAICNMALSHLGIAKEIANLETENSQEASACRRFFAQARDNTLRDYPWPFATKISTLALVEEDPNDEWGYSYRVPTDFLRISRILSGIRNDSARTRVPYRIVRDEAGLLIYTDKEDAEIEYVMRETDPSRYPGDFAMALSLRLAAYIAPRLTAGDPYKLSERALRLHALEISKAEATSVNEEQAEEAPESEMVDER